MRGVCVLTGSSGYVGSHIADRLEMGGWEVRALLRRPSSQKQRFTEIEYELGQPIAPDALAGANALVHLAYDFSLNRWPEIERVNVEGSRLLFAAAKEAGIDRIVHMSSVAAFPGAISLYGRAKLGSEQAALDVGAAIVRPGLVWGPEGAATFGSLRRAVESLPVVPLLVPSELELYLAHEDDLAELVEGLLDQWPLGSRKRYVAAATSAVEFGALLRSFALQANRRPRFLRLPWRSVWLGLKALERLGVQPPFRSDGLLSLVACDGEPLTRATDSTDRYCVRFRSYELA